MTLLADLRAAGEPASLSEHLAAAESILQWVGFRVVSKHAREELPYRARAFSDVCQVRNEIWFAMDEITAEEEGTGTAVIWHEVGHALSDAIMYRSMALSSGLNWSVGVREVGRWGSRTLLMLVSDLGACHLDQSEEFPCIMVWALRMLLGWSLPDPAIRPSAFQGDAFLFSNTSSEGADEVVPSLEALLGMEASPFPSWSPFRRTGSSWSPLPSTTTHEALWRRFHRHYSSNLSEDELVKYLKRL